MHANGAINEGRLALALDARSFFLELLAAPIGMIALENPTPLKIVNLPPYTQSIQPFEFGEPYSKKTNFWLKNLPPLMATQIISNYRTYINSGGVIPDGYKEPRGKERSRTFMGIAEAMADQWGNYDH